MLSSLTVLAAYLLAVALVPLVRKLAIHRKLLDYPDHGRRRHAEPVPRLGGIAVFLSLVIVASVAATLDDPAHIAIMLPFIVSMAVAATILFATGLADDIWGVRPAGKLAAQSIAAVVVYQAGFRLDVLMLTPSHAISLGAFSLPVTVLWIVGLSNAFNLVDGADGLAGGVAVVALISTAISAAVLNDPTVVWCSLALLGAMLGFLRFNFPPARIFLGDSGSLVVGFLLAVLTVKGAARRDGSVYALAPIFALSYPLLDTGISMMRRWLRGEPLSRADGRHIHHQLQKLGVGPRQSVLLICALSGVIAGLGLSASFAPPEFTLAIAMAGVAILLFIFVYGLRWLEYHEFFDAGASVTSAARQARTVIRDKIHARDVAALLRGAPTFEALATILEESAPSFRFVHAELQGRSEKRQFADPIAVQAHSTRTWKLEYPIGTLDSTLPCLIILSIWSATEGRGITAGPERVAQILAPAVGHWLAAHADDPAVRALIAEKFPAVVTPTRPFPALTGDFPSSDANAVLRRSSGEEQRLSGD